MCSIVDRAFHVAAANGAQLTLMHALGLDALGPLRNLLGEQADSVAHRALEQRREALEAIAAEPIRNRGVTARLVVEEGLASVAVPACALATDADLVVVGARGESTVRRMLLGSTASRLLRKSACPVLVVKRPCTGPYRSVLVPVDFSPGSALSIRMAREVAPQADLILLHVFDVPFEGMLQHAGVSRSVIHQYRIDARTRASAQLHAMCQGLGLEPASHTSIVEHGNAAGDILARQAHYHCDLVVMGKHGTHVTEELLLGSVTRRVVAEARADVLVVLDKRQPPLDPALHSQAP